jgi:hypothetical protein
MFVDQKKVNIDIRSLIAGASLDELQKLAGDVTDEKYLGMHTPIEG